MVGCCGQSGIVAGDKKAEEEQEVVEVEKMICWLLLFLFALWVGIGSGVGEMLKGYCDAFCSLRFLSSLPSLRFASIDWLVGRLAGLRPVLEHA